jgi:putative aldouronate transport system substrate-binding protein
MKRKLVLVLSLLLTIVFVFSLSGCSKETKEGETTAKTTTKQAQQSTNEATEKETEREMVTIRFMHSEHPNYPKNQDALTFQELGTRLNVNLVLEGVPSTNYNEKKNIVIASGNLPDIIWITAGEASTYGMKGLFTPLNDLIDESKYLKDLLTPEVIVNQMASNKNVYSIPQFSESTYMKAFMIRKDWLEMVNQDEPVTTADFYNALLAFRDEIPDITGIKDVVPFTNRTGLINLMENFAPSFGTRMEWKITEENKYEYTPVTQEYKETLMYLNKLYTEGLLDKEYATLSDAQWSEKISSGTAGGTMNWLSRPDSFNQILAETSPGAELMVICPPKGPGGEAGVEVQAATAPDRCVAISAKSENISRAFELIDYIFGPEGKDLFNYGVEGVTYTVENGKPVIKDEVKKEISGAVSALEGASKYGIFPQTWIWYVGFDSGLQIGFYGPAFQEGSNKLEPFKLEALPVISYSENSMDEVKNILSALQPLKEEYENKFVMGLIPFSEWDNYVGMMEEYGCKRYEEIQNEGYNSYKELLESISK